MLNEGDRETEFVDAGNAPEFFANGLHDVEVIGSVSRFVLFVVKRSPAGVLYREPSFTCIMPNDGIGPAIALTLRKAGGSIIVPAAFATAKELFLQKLPH
jgi:hypothetical protein